MPFLLVLALLSQGKTKFVSHGSAVLDPSIISLESQPAALADILMQTEAGVVLSDNVLGAFDREADRVEGLPKEATKRYPLIRQATTVKRRGQALILDVEVAFDDPQVARFICQKILASYVDERLERRAVMLERKVRLIDEELRQAKGPRAEQLKDEKARAERQLRDRFSELRILEGCTQP